VLGDVEKEQFVAFMREYERFCGVMVITYCLMSNHFHILLKVPERPNDAGVIGDEWSQDNATAVGVVPGTGLSR
jgi:REP element-mobilizing transposase RayT